MCARVSSVHTRIDKAVRETDFPQTRAGDRGDGRAGALEAEDILDDRRVVRSSSSFHQRKSRGRELGRRAGVGGRGGGQISPRGPSGSAVRVLAHTKAHQVHEGRQSDRHHGVPVPAEGLRSHKQGAPPTASSGSRARGNCPIMRTKFERNANAKKNNDTLYFFPFEKKYDV